MKTASKQIGIRVRKNRQSASLSVLRSEKNFREEVCSGLCAWAARLWRVLFQAPKLFREVGPEHLALEEEEWRWDAPERWLQ